MRYSTDEIREFVSKPDQHKAHYTQSLLEELIAYLYSEKQQSEVRAYLEELPDHANSLRVQIAVVHLSANEKDKGSIDKLIANIDLASKDYRDLLMAYYI